MPRSWGPTPTGNQPAPKKRRRPPAAPRRSRALATREGGIVHLKQEPREAGIGRQPRRAGLTPQQRRIANQLVSGYEHGPRVGSLARELGRLGNVYLNNPVSRNPIVGRRGLLGGLEDLIRSTDPIALGQTAAANVEHPFRQPKPGEISAGVVIGGPGGFRVARPREAAQFVERPRTRVEAEARLAHLEKQQEAFHKKVAGRYKQVSPEAQRWMNEHGRGGRIGGKSVEGRTAGQRIGKPDPASEQFLARLVGETVAKHPEHPAVKSYVASVAEADKLRQALSTQHMPGEAPPHPRAGELKRELDAIKKDPANWTRTGAKPHLKPEAMRRYLDLQYELSHPPPPDYGTVREPAPKPMPRVAPVKAEGPSNIPGIERTPAEAASVVSGALGAARRGYGRQRTLRREELGRRVAKAQAAQEAAGGGFAGVRAAKGQLKGELPKVQFEKLKQGTLSKQDLEGLIRQLQQHPSPELNWFDRNIIGPDALKQAFTENRNPAPHEIDVLRRAFGEDAAKVMADKSFARKVAENAIGLWNLPRALAASIDVSFPGRQGIGVLAANPKIWAKAWEPQMKALPYRLGERYYHDQIAHYHEHPLFSLSQEAGVKYTELGRGAAQREEPFVSKFSENIPGVRASARAYTLYGDYSRLRLFEYYYNKAKRKGVNVESMNELRSIGKLVNTFSGRGGGKRLQQASPIANAFFFAPQLIASRVNMLNPVWGRTLTPFARHELNLVRLRLGLGAGTVLSGAALAGAKVESDPRNADFAKIKVGNTRFDILAGHQQYPRALAQIEQGKIISSTTGRTLKLGSGYGQLSQWDIAERFGASKLNPSASLVYDLARKRDFAGQPFSWSRAIKQRTIPLSIQDSLDLYHQGGAGAIPKALGGYGIAATGVGAQTYGPRPPKGTTPKELRAARQHQEVHLQNLVRKGELPRKQLAEYREALSIYDRRNALNKAIEAATVDKPVTREKQKMEALLGLLGRHKLLKPAEVRKYKHYYASKDLSAKDLQRDREWFWRESGVAGMVTWYRQKAGATD